MRAPPDMSRESAAAAAGHGRVAGVDEVGRGPLAGPVLAAAVILDPARVPEGLADSKALTARRREALAPRIAACARWALGAASARVIDEIGIEAATQLAQMRAIGRLAPSYVLVDGPRLPRALGLPGEAVVRGDALSCSIAAASILAKVTRDRIMQALASRHPGYGWESNKGYGSAVHREAILSQGGTQHHRWTFAPLHNM